MSIISTKFTGKNMLWLAIYFPYLSLESFAHADENLALVITARQGNREVVFAANACAAAQGIKPAMRLNTAYTLVDNLYVQARDEAAELNALEHIAAWAYQFTSFVSLEPSQILLLEIEGSVHYFGGLQELFTRVVSGVAALGYNACFAIAPTPLAATVFAKTGKPVIVTQTSALKSLLADLTLEYSGMSDSIVQSLKGMGIQTLQQCFSLPRSGLQKRYSKVMLDYLDRLCGDRADPRKSYNVPDKYDNVISLAYPVENTDALLFSARRLLLELSGFLKSKGAGTQELQWVLVHEGVPDSRFLLRMAESSRDYDRFFSLLKERLARLELDAPVVSLGLLVNKLCSLQDKDRDFWNKTEGAEAWAPFIERIEGRLGDDAIQGICLWPDYRPEKAWRTCEPGEETRIAMEPQARPLWLLPQPSEITRINNHLYQGGELKLVQGPERIESGWWDGEDTCRDYYVAQNPKGECFWIYCDVVHAGKWFVHGLFA